jgi:hypothetical protein
MAHLLMDIAKQLTHHRENTRILCQNESGFSGYSLRISEVTRIGEVVEEV